MTVMIGLVFTNTTDNEYQCYSPNHLPQFGEFRKFIRDIWHPVTKTILAYLKRV